MDHHAPLKFFATVLLLAAPLWALNFVLPDVEFLPKGIPITDLALAFTPTIAAVILTWHRDGRKAVAAMMRRAWDIAQLPNKAWLYVAVLLMPALFAITYLGTFVLDYSLIKSGTMPLLLAPAALLLFIILAAGEELGYFGYLWDAWEQRFGPLLGAMLFALPWTAMHIPSILMQDRSWFYIASAFIGSAAIRVLWTWLYHGCGRSIFAVIIVHAMANLMGAYMWQEYTIVATVIAAAVIAALAGQSLRFPRARATPSIAA